jgi:hypothetical protein
VVRGPRQPEKGRLITLAIDDQLFDLTIIELVIFHSRAVATRILDRDPTAEEVSEYTEVVAKELSEMGWFTAQEYMEEWVANEALGLDFELNEFMNGNGDGT